MRNGAAVVVAAALILQPTAWEDHPYSVVVVAAMVDLTRQPIQLLLVLLVANPTRTRRAAEPAAATEVAAAG